MSVVSASRTNPQKEHFYIHKVVAELVVEDLVTNEVSLKKYCLPMSDHEEDSIDVQSFSNFSSAESLGGACRSHIPMDSIHWNYCKFHHSLTDQLRGSSVRLVIQVMYKLKYQKELMVKLEKCWNNV